MGSSKPLVIGSAWDRWPAVFLCRNNLPMNVANKTSFIPMRGSAYVAVTAVGPPAANGNALVSAYASAKLLAPNGSALAANNRATVLLLPGTYEVGSGAFVLDTEFVDLIGVGEKEDIVIISHDKTIVQTADNVRIKNLSCVTTYTDGTPQHFGDVANHGGYYPDSNLPSTVIEDVVFNHTNGHSGGAHRGLAMRSGIEYSGTYRRVKCIGGFGFGGYAGGLASGYFEDCEGDGDSDFTGELTGNTSGGATGVFIRCKTTGDFCFAGEGGIASGLFIECEARGTECFGGFGVASGSFIRCKGGEMAFGGGDLFYHLENPDRGASGYFEDCVGRGSSAFGGFGADGAAGMKGTMVRCRISPDPFADVVVDGGSLTGNVTGIVRDSYFKATAANSPAVIAGDGAEIYNCTLEGSGSGKSIDANEPVTVKIGHCRLLQGIGANITNSVLPAHNAGVADTPRLLVADVTPVTNIASASEEDLISFTIPANTLVSDGDWIVFEGSHVSSGEFISVNFYFAGTNCGSNTNIEIDAPFRASIVRLSSNSARVNVVAGSPPFEGYNPLSVSTHVGSLDFANPIVFKTTNPSHTNSITQHFLIGWHYPAA